MKKANFNNNIDLDIYRKAVQDLANRRSSELIANSTQEEAAIVFKNFLEQATREIYIYDKNLSGDLLKLECGAIDLLIKKISDKLEIVFIVDDDNSIMPNINGYLNNENYNVKYRLATEEFKSRAITELGNDYYFAVADGRMFRQEFKDSSIPRSAICSFNNEAQSKRLLELFKVFLLDKEYELFH